MSRVPLLVNLLIACREEGIPENMEPVSAEMSGEVNVIERIWRMGSNSETGEEELEQALDSLSYLEVDPVIEDAFMQNQSGLYASPLFKLEARDPYQFLPSAIRFEMESTPEFFFEQALDEEGGVHFSSEPFEAQLKYQGCTMNIPDVILSTRHDIEEYYCPAGESLKPDGSARIGHISASANQYLNQCPAIRSLLLLTMEDGIELEDVHICVDFGIQSPEMWDYYESTYRN